MDPATLEPGEPVKQFSVMLQNRAGALASLTKLLRNNNIEMVGISVQDSRDATIARLVLTDPDLAEQIFIEKGIPFTTSTLVVIALKEAGPGLLQVLDTLMVAETNIDFAYALMPSAKGQALLAMHVEDHDFASTVLNQAGFKIVYQCDLSR
ncbi:amino acid-binding protein [Haloferula helveola]|uniref:Amino acid-binding protein n=1 Tax=Haloferula helveola TaxID=490095 RepID=A0ABM7RJD7_9BACT|nr:amino acid-binding protein [Haloferula helveola]